MSKKPPNGNMKEEEFIYAYDRNGEKVGEKREKKQLIKEIREHSLQHGDAPYAVAVIHLVFLRTTGELRVIKRAHKSENPDLWDKTVGGHVRAGETYDSALIRESNEEISVKVVLSDMCYFPRLLREFDLNEFAIVRRLDFRPWSKSTRKMRNDDTWEKRDRVATYFGVYDGEFRFRDGETVESEDWAYDELKAEIKQNPGEYTYDLKEMMRQYAYFLESFIDYKPSK
ncbi:MAG: NUDIX domain-containing protein [Planctomycetota bacterium]|jgi:ADP-ribose pyrophosphatase YjhB (NUDIX family)